MFENHLHLVALTGESKLISMPLAMYLVHLVKRDRFIITTCWADFRYFFITHRVVWVLDVDGKTSAEWSLENEAGGTRTVNGITALDC